MIKTFTDAQTQELYLTGKARRVPPDVASRAVRKLEQVNAATRIEDLRVPPGNQLHPLEGDRRGQHSISVNDQWRVCFRFEGGDAYEVEFFDYH
jgi:proteic killer suppression protein